MQGWRVGNVACGPKSEGMIMSVSFCVHKGLRVHTRLVAGGLN